MDKKLKLLDLIVPPKTTTVSNWLPIALGVKLNAKFKLAVFVILVSAVLLSCSHLNTTPNDTHRVTLVFSEYFYVMNPQNGVLSFLTSEGDSVYVIKRRINDWARSNYRKLIKGDAVQIALLRNEKLDSRDLGVQSALKLEFSIDNQARHNFDFSSNGNIYDSPDLIITDDSVYLKDE